MTLEELQTYEDVKKVKNPYFRKKLPVWRKYALFVLNNDTKDVSPDATIYLLNQIDDYRHIILVPDTSLQQELEKKIKKLQLQFDIKTDGLLDEQEDI